jgi:hypothetical protein
MIDRGLADSEFGVVIISPAFFAKHWTRKELSGLRAREEGGRKVILPVWHNVTKEKVAEYSPTLADAIAVSTDYGLDAVARKILAVVFGIAGGGSSMKTISVTRRLNELLGVNTSKNELIAFFQSTFSFGPYPHLFGLIFRNPWLRFGVAFGGHTYDMAAYYVGHGIRFEPVMFRDVLASPFESPLASPPEINRRILEAIAGIRSTMKWFETNPKTASSMLIENVDGAESMCFKHADFFSSERFPLDGFRVNDGRLGGRRLARELRRAAPPIPPWSAMMSSTREVAYRGPTRQDYRLPR